ncbi:uncharacterized protein FOMMEDRAFT_30196 [Fomitiporia mediterranea MF3/22]|uniref:uncharacterized protein n=1 Tax=Fomitiporia mediterranea (strain MF3/22) TaxID=694068 RepID=UPI0004409031|nr:uncharacterized protein FOMMEDRAFT_30196 [Fomitiporia mediterranea MF3/22]EJD01531.1 hypothetical protein FOMMEDRAFT_30196 [Fomitiporia mediterranea MF3/22]
MADPRYGRGPPSRSHDVENRLKDWDRALRADILAKAQRQYESAAHELRVRAQREAQAVAKLQAQQAQYRALTRPPPRIQVQAPIQTRMQAQPRYAQPPQPVSRTSAYIGRPAPAPASAPTSAPGPSPVTPQPRQSYAAPREIPPRSSTPTARTMRVTPPAESNALELEELKRRYFAQLADAQSPEAREPQPRHHIRHLASDSAHAHYTRASAVGHPRGQVRSLADEYLDFYMPAKRGPQSSSFYNAPQMASPRQYERRSPERYYQELRDERSHAYSAEVARRSVLPERPLPQPVEQRHHQQSRTPAPAAKESPSPPQASKSNLSFLLNPTQGASPKANQNFDGRAQSSVLANWGPHSKDDVTGEHSPRHSTQDDYHGTAARSANNYPENDSDMDRRDLDVKPSITRADSQRSEENRKHWWLRSKTSSHSPPRSSEAQKPNEQAGSPPGSVLKERLRSSYSRPEKRKASPPPQSPAESEASVIEEPRPKKRAYGRLPRTVESDSMSDLSPEEEEGMEDHHSMQQESDSRKSATLDATRSKHAISRTEQSDKLDDASRHRVKRSATDDGTRLDARSNRRRISTDQGSGSSMSSMSISSAPSPVAYHPEAASLKAEEVDDEIASSPVDKDEDAQVPGSSGLKYSTETSKRRHASEPSPDEGHEAKRRLRPRTNAA